MEPDHTPPYALPIVGFRSRKAAQICAFFAAREGGCIEKLKLIKLIYLSERSFLADNNHPMLWDEFYSLPHGPICSSTLSGIDGYVDPAIWSAYITRDGNLVSCLQRLEASELDELSRSEMRTIEAIWAQFGMKSASQLRNFTHDHCPEYTDVSRGRVPISYRDVWAALGAEGSEEMEAELTAMRRAESALTA